jgi:hypothetical protein
LEIQTGFIFLSIFRLNITTGVFHGHRQDCHGAVLVAWAGVVHAAAERVVAHFVPSAACVVACAGLPVAVYVAVLPPVVAARDPAVVHVPVVEHAGEHSPADEVLFVLHLMDVTDLQDC